MTTVIESAAPPPRPAGQPEPAPQPDPEASSGGPTLSRRGLLAVAVSAPVLTVAAGFGANLATPGTAHAAIPLPLTPPLPPLCHFRLPLRLPLPFIFV